MLKIQEWLQQNNFNYPLLETQLGITSNFHPSDDRVILNYSQINSPKLNEIVRECRGLCLNSKTGDLIGRGFRRFFNLNETQEPFDWSDFTCFEKVDGSLVLIYYYKDKWHLQTRNSYSQSEINDSGITWHELIESTLPEGWKDSFDKNTTYVGEICSRYNKVVVDHPIPIFFLLSMFDNITGREHYLDSYIQESETLKLNRPNIHKLSSQLEVEQYLKQLEQDKKLDEGFVLRDKNNNRIKCKSALYLRFHYIFSNGEPKTEKLLEFILNGEVDELLSYFPVYKLRSENIKERAEKLFKELDNLWYCYHKEPNRKLFALAVKDHPLASVLFNLRDDKGEFKQLFNEAIMKKPHLLE